MWILTPNRFAADIDLQLTDSKNSCHSSFFPEINFNQRKHRHLVKYVANEN